MKNLIICTAVAVATLFASCTEEEGTEFANEEKTALNIQTNIAGASVSTRGPIAAFPVEAAMGLFVTTGSLGTNYNGYIDHANVKTVFDGSKWTPISSIYLSPANATVYAYYPFSAVNTNGMSIPIEHASQTDYMYGTHTPGQNTINSSNPLVHLTMKHALTLLQFKIGRINYTGQGIVTSIAVGNASGKTYIYSRGSLNIETGIITKATGGNNQVVIQNKSGLYTIPIHAGSYEEHPNLRIMLLPVDRTAADGDIKIYFTIDGRIYTYDVPASTIWNPGTKNVYTVTLSGTKLIVGGVTITDWTEGTSGSAQLL